MVQSTRRLLIVFAVLLLATVLWTVGQKRRTTSRERSFARFDIEDVLRVEIAKQDYDITFENAGGRWVLTEPLEYPANQSAVEDMLEQAGSLAVVNLVSSNQRNHDLYEVGPDTGVLVRLFGGRDAAREIFSFYVGKMTSDFGHTYVREFGNDDVYTATGLLNGYFDKEVANWRDRTILSLAQAEIQEVHAERDTLQFVLGRRGRLPGAPDAPWAVHFADDPVPTAADSAQAERLAQRMATLSASSFPAIEDEVNADWENPVARLQVVMTDGSTHEVRAWEMPDDQNRWYVRTVGNETVFLMYRSNLDNFWRARDMLAIPEETGDPGTG